MTKITIEMGDVFVADHPVLSPYVVAARSLAMSGVVARQNTVELPRGGIAFIDDDVSDAGTISFEALILGDDLDDAKALWLALAAAWSPGGGDELALTIGTGTQVYRGRPLSCVPVLDGYSTAVARCTFTVTDPRWFSTATQSVSVTVASSSGGMDTPMDTPMVTTGSGSTGDAAVFNAGTADAPWYAYIVGPVTTPRLILNGQLLEIVGDVPAGSMMTVDSETGVIRLDGASRPWDTFESTWWEIPPGASTLSFRAAAGTGSMVLVWQDASKG